VTGSWRRGRSAKQGSTAVRPWEAWDGPVETGLGLTSRYRGAIYVLPRFNEDGGIHE
jgi:hypothetical protein